MTPNLVFFIGSQTFALPNYGNKTGVCQIRLALGGLNAPGADYPEFFRKTEHLFLRLFGISNGILSPFAAQGRAITHSHKLV